MEGYRIVYNHQGMIRVEQMGRITHSMEVSIFNLIDRNMELELVISQLRTQLSTSLTQEQVDHKIKYFQQQLTSKQNLIRINQGQLNRLNQEVQILKGKLSHHQEKEIETKRQMTELQISSAHSLHQLQVQNNNLKSQLALMQQSLQQNQVSHRSFVELIQLKEKESFLEGEPSELKDIEVCSDCRSRVFMVFYNKEKKYRDLKNENQRLNQYIRDITQDPKYQKNINSKLTVTQIQSILQVYQKEVLKQLHYYKNTVAEQKAKIITNLEVLLKNFKKQLIETLLDNQK